MDYERLANHFSKISGVEGSTMMGTPCLRYKGEFIGMMFDQAEALIIKVPSERVNELIASGVGIEFNFTKQRFKEWVMIPIRYQDDYEVYMNEALDFAQRKERKASGVR